MIYPRLSKIQLIVELGFGPFSTISDVYIHIEMSLRGLLWNQMSIGLNGHSRVCPIYEMVLGLTTVFNMLAFAWPAITALGQV